jgi:hypothetical protein
LEDAGPLYYVETVEERAEGSEFERNLRTLIQLYFETLYDALVNLYTWSCSFGKQIF